MSGRLFFAIPGPIDLRTGGYGYDRRLIEGLRGLDWQVEHLALGGSFPYPTDEDLDAADAALGALGDGSLVLVDGLAFGAMPDIAARHSRRLRLVALVHHPLALEAGIDAATAARFLQSERLALAHVGAVITTSRATAAEVARDYGVPAAIIETAEPGTLDVGIAAASGDPPRVLALATLTRRKGHDALVRALAECRALPWTARFVGSAQFDPAWASELRQLIDLHGLGERIALVGETEDPGSELLAADIFALPSRHEGYGMAFAEALSCGLPIVGYAAGAVPDLVPAAAGFLVPTDDEGALAEALAMLIGNPKLRAEKASGARAAGARLPGWSDTAKVVAGMLERVART